MEDARAYENVSPSTSPIRGEARKTLENIGYGVCGCAFLCRALARAARFPERCTVSQNDGKTLVKQRALTKQARENLSKYSDGKIPFSFNVNYVYNN